jgi:hypothetical protein
MKKILVLLALILAFETAKTNPIVVPPPPILNELYFNGSNWEMELIFHEQSYSYMGGLDSIRIITSTDTAMIKTTISLSFEQIVVITQDSLLSALSVNKSGDLIRFQQCYHKVWYDMVDPVAFGNYHQGEYNSYVNAPDSRQSLVMYNYEDDDMEYFLLKDNYPTIGSANNNNVYGTFKGIVVDLDSNPIRSKTIIQCRMNVYNDYDLTDAPTYSLLKVHTDTSGTFLDTGLFARNYSVTLYLDSLWLYDSTFAVTINPDTINYYEFVVDTSSLIYVNVKDYFLKNNYSLTAFPNPSTGETTISFETPANNRYSKALVKIYNSAGEMICILPVNINSSQNSYAVRWDGMCGDKPTASGIYYCKLELDGRKAASTKIVISK